MALAEEDFPGTEVTDVDEGSQALPVALREGNRHAMARPDDDDAGIGGKAVLLLPPLVSPAFRFLLPSGRPHPPPPPPPAPVVSGGDRPSARSFPPAPDPVRPRRE